MNNHYSPLTQLRKTSMIQKKSKFLVIQTIRVDKCGVLQVHVKALSINFY